MMHVHIAMTDKSELSESAVIARVQKQRDSRKKQGTIQRGNWGIEGRGRQGKGSMGARQSSRGARTTGAGSRRQAS